MENSKIEFKIGNIQFIGEGEQEWLSKQLDNILNKIPELINYNVPDNKEKNETKSTIEKVENEENISPSSTNRITETLATFLRNKKATDNQRRKFLATAVYLQLNGKDNLVTKDITDALKKAKQTKLSNPAHQLSQNIKQGLCEKHGKSFYVTPEGISKIME